MRVGQLKEVTAHLRLSQELDQMESFPQQFVCTVVQAGVRLARDADRCAIRLRDGEHRPSGRHGVISITPTYSVGPGPRRSTATSSAPPARATAAQSSLNPDQETR